MDDPLRCQTVDQIIDQVMALPSGTKMHILAPRCACAQRPSHQKVFDDAKKSGYVRVRVDGLVYDLTEVPALEKNKKHNIELVIDRMIMKDDIRKRLADSLETALKIAGGLVIVDVIDGEEMMFSQNYACEQCGVSMEELTPRMFSFNSPFGACEECSGLGFMMKIDPELVVRDKNKSINEGAIAVTGWMAPNIEDSMAAAYYRGLAQHYGFSLDTPYKDLPEKIKNILLYGSKGEKFKVEFSRSYGQSTYTTDFEGIVNNLQRRHKETTSDWMRAELEGYMSNHPCPSCHGMRLKPQVLAVTVGREKHQRSDRFIHNKRDCVF